MKNIHILPTDKPSRLYRSDDDFILHQIPTTLFQMQNIYITSDEEIKEGDWCLIDHNVGQSNGYSILKCLKADVQNGEYLFQDKDGDKFITGRCKKIILTTDQDLIKDGVWGIEDGFLEWFVKNPSCEEVKVELHIGSLRWSDSKNSYKIIIPKEEPKLQCKDCNDSLTDCTCIEDTVDMKQETLEEVKANSYIDFTKSNEDVSMYSFVAGWDRAIKWQQEQDKNKYSEEDMKSSFQVGFNVGYNDEESPSYLTFEEWIKEYKKK
jgi:hypothetical protein